MKAIPALSVGCWNPVLVRHLLDSRRRSELPQHLCQRLWRTPTTVPTGLTCLNGLLWIRLASHAAVWKRPCVCRRLHAPRNHRRQHPPVLRIGGCFPVGSQSQDPRQVAFQAKIACAVRSGVHEDPPDEGAGILRGLEAGLIVLQRRE